MIRRAIVKGHGVTPSIIARYLPDNYRVVGAYGEGAVLIEGRDVGGWTFDDYVQPRLASGMYYAKEY